MTLVIMAAGMGSRFGGLKQIEPVGPNGEFIIDYSIYDAIRVGFNKVVFIIREENYEIFKETIGKRVEDKIEVEYAFQENYNLPEGIKVPKDRIKPLGTAHAIYSAKDVIKEPFAIINADDFYGYDAYLKAATFLNENTDDYAMISYLIGNTLTDNGSVKRGYCEACCGYLTNIIESKVERINGEINVSPLDGRETFKVKDTDLVSMNLFCFKPDILEYIENHIKDFFDNNDIKTSEYLITDVVFERINNNEIKLRIIDTDAKWYGITYKEDKPALVSAINNMVKEGMYPQKIKRFQ